MTSKEKALQGKREKLGSRNPKCVICGEHNIVSLTTIRENQLTQKRRALLEKHHLAYRHEGGTIIVCQNCHSRLSFEQEVNWPKELKQADRDPSALFKALAKGNLDAFAIFLSDDKVSGYMEEVLKQALGAEAKDEPFNIDMVHKLFEEEFKCCLIDPYGIKETVIRLMIQTIQSL